MSKNNLNRKKLANFIDGEYRAPLAGKYLENFNPATGEIYSELPDSRAEDIALAVAAAKAAFPRWSTTPIEERSRILLKIADLLEARLEEFAHAESTDQGKTLRQAREIEIPRAVKNFRFFATAVLHRRDFASDMDGRALNYVQRSPLGVTGLISPWNLPLYLLTWKIAPALATGNTAVCKPSELTPYTAHMLGEILREAGLPRGVCNIVLGLGEYAGEALVQNPDIKLISFTGGSETGARIAANAAPLFKRMSLELGGKNPALIFADADLESCISMSVRSSFTNQGEICLCNSRIYVEEKIYSQFLERLVSATKLLKVGDPLAADTFLGPVVSREHQEKILGYLELARKEGATIHTGGKAAELSGKFAHGYFIEPTVISGVAADSRLIQEEIFGPVVTVSPFRSEAEAITLANSTRYGLSASVWTGNGSRAQRVAHAIEAGVVWVNTWMLRDLRIPFGGAKQSGVGREGGDYSLDFFTETKNICIQF